MTAGRRARTRATTTTRIAASARSHSAASRFSTLSCRVRFSTATRGMLTEYYYELAPLRDFSTDTPQASDPSPPILALLRAVRTGEH